MPQLFFANGLHSTTRDVLKAAPICSSRAPLMSVYGSSWPSRPPRVTCTKFRWCRSLRWYLPSCLKASSLSSRDCGIFSDPDTCSVRRDLASLLPADMISWCSLVEENGVPWHAPQLRGQDEMGG